MHLRCRVTIEPVSPSPLLRGIPKRDGSLAQAPDTPAIDALAGRFRAEFGHPASREASLELDLNGPNAARAVEWIERHARELSFRCRLFFDEAWDPAWGEPEWYTIVPRIRYPGESIDELPTFAHAAGQCLVSSAVRDLAVREGWTGLGFVPCTADPRHTATFLTRMWWFGVASRPIGRGVDHPWIDPAVVPSDDHHRFPMDPCFRRGFRHADASHLRPALVRGHALAARLLALLDTSRSYNGSFAGVARYLRPALPASDVAYAWVASEARFLDAAGRRGPGTRLPDRPLCVTRRVRDGLVGAGLLGGYEFEPLRILDAPEPPSVDLDAAGAPPPGPLFPPELCAAASAAPATLGHVPRLHTVEDVIASAGPFLGRLRRAGVPLVESPAVDEGPGRTDPAIRVPAAWGRLASITPRYTWEYEYAGAGGCRDETRWLRSPGIVEDPAFPDPSAFVAFAVSGSGDTFIFDTADPRMPADCRVLRHDHETLTISRVWDSVPNFVQDLLVRADRYEQEQARSG